MPTYDTVIIGAGLAGLHCARRLAHLGLKVLLADRKRQVDQRVHTTGIFVRKTLSDYRLPEACLGPAVSEVRLYSPKGKTLSLHSPRQEFRVGRMALLYRHFFEQALQLGVDWAPEHHYAGSSATGSGSELHFYTPQGPRRVQARWIIGADGAYSRVAQDLKLSQNSHWIVGVEDVYRFRGKVKEAKKPIFHCYCDAKLAPGYIAWAIDDGEELHLGVGGYPQRFQAAAALEAFKTRAREHFSLKEWQWQERRGGRIPVGGILENIASPRGLLIGDAAGAVSPLTAGGLDPCLRLSDLASWVLWRCQANPERTPEFLARYRGARFKAKFSQKQRLRQVFSAIRWNSAFELAFRALTIPSCTRWAGQVFFSRGSFPDIAELAELPKMTE